MGAMCVMTCQFVCVHVSKYKRVSVAMSLSVFLRLSVCRPQGCSVLSVQCPHKHIHSTLQWTMVESTPKQKRKQNKKAGLNCFQRQSSLRGTQTKFPAWSWRKQGGVRVMLLESGMCSTENHKTQPAAAALWCPGERTHSLV